MSLPSETPRFFAILGATTEGLATLDGSDYVSAEDLTFSVAGPMDVYVVTSVETPNILGATSVSATSLVQRGFPVTFSATTGAVAGSDGGGGGSE